MDSNTPTAQEVDETLKRLSSRKGVKAVVILNNEGQAIRSTLDETLTKQYGQLISALVQQARTTVNTLDDQNDLTFMRVRTKKHEVMIAPDREYLLIVVQNPQESLQQ
ncbi:Putative Dynein light chain roadblock-type [Lichtheimia ramosa]|uniref:Dynein light chain roadblock n=1 Tax=Lichtheimia ramosa TaxID=688394 RepID=A0A077WXF7_9FUNG|nr:Putative Dynein light chain roadblock-type [Lichtheimia ramosa]